MSSVTKTDIIAKPLDEPKKLTELEAAFVSYFEQGESGKQVVNSILRAVGAQLLSKSRIAELEVIAKDGKKGGLTVEV